MTDVVVQGEVYLEVENLTLDTFVGSGVSGGGLRGGDVSISNCDVTSLNVGNSGTTSVADCVVSEQASLFGGAVAASAVTAAGSLQVGSDSLAPSVARRPVSTSSRSRRCDCRTSRSAMRQTEGST